jgi:hypothetical protein
MKAVEVMEETQPPCEAVMDAGRDELYVNSNNRTLVTCQGTYHGNSIGSGDAMSGYITHIGVDSTAICGPAPAGACRQVVYQGRNKETQPEHMDPQQGMQNAQMCATVMSTA